MSKFVLSMLSFAVICMIGSVSATEEVLPKSKDDPFVFSCQRALAAKGEWRSGKNCRGPAGDIISDMVFPANANVKIIVDEGIKK